MKFYPFLITLIFIVNTIFAEEIKEEQVKVAYVYNFLKNTSWKNEKELETYCLLIVSKNETLNNMFSMLASRKQLKDKNLEVLIYDEKKSYKNIQAIYIDNSFIEVYEKLFFEFEKQNTLFISDEYEDKKQVMINLLRNEAKVNFEINKANILNRSLEISPNLILLGGTQIDVAKLYKSSQDELKEQKETIISLNERIKEKNSELISKIDSIEKQKIVIEAQIKNIEKYEDKINNQGQLLERQNEQLQEQTKQLNEIYKSIESEKAKLSNAILDVKNKEDVVKSLVQLQKQKQEEFEKTKKDLELLNFKIEEQRNNLLLKEDIISNQKNIIMILILLSFITIILGLNIILKNRLLKNLSQTDSLSGLNNRRFMLKKLEDEIAKYKRYKTPFSVVLIDIDHFKKINDNYGHDKGDFVIKKISSLIKQNIRTTDISARWGGEEFLILTPNSDLKSALKLSQNLKDLIEKSEFEMKYSVTISIGISTFSENLTQEELLKLADNALYKAKKNGRNRVEFIS